jgi:putative DNA primase/helicase
MNEKKYDLWVEEGVDLGIENPIALEEYVIKAHKTRKEEIASIRNAIAKILHTGKTLEEESDVEKYFDGEKFVAKKLANDITEKFIFKTMRDNEELYVYCDGVYIPEGEVVVREISEKILKERGSTNKINEVVGHVKRSTYVRREDFDNNPYMVNLLNGIFDLKKMKIISHTPKILMTSQLPITFDKRAECTKIENFIGEVVENDKIPLIQEFIGYCLWKEHHIHNSLMLVGKGANGKSTFLDMLSSFIGNRNIKHISLQDICTKRFSLAEMYGTHANIYDDLPDNVLSHTGIFKMLTGQSFLSAEKKFKDYFNFTSFAKMIFSTNQVPESRDMSMAFYRRIIIVKFPIEFLGKRADKKLIKKLTTKNELSGLFNWAIQGLKRLLRNEEFTNTPSVIEQETMYKRESSSIACFSMDELEKDNVNVLSKEEVFQRYVRYCELNDLKPKSNVFFGRDLPNYMSVETGKRTIDAERKMCWIGIKFKEEVQKGLEKFK